MQSKKKKVHSACIKLDFVLQAFGGAVTPENKCASRFSRHVEYQFNDNGHMLGLKLLTYNFEKTRVSSAAGGHANFNVFYYLLAGCTPEMKADWHLGDASGHQYLNKVQSKPPILSPFNHFNPDNLEQLSDHMKVIGIPKRSHEDIFRLLAGILNLGNISFVRNTLSGANEPTGIKNVSQLNVTAQILGITPSHLQNCLTFETKVVGRELCTMILDHDTAVRQRDKLAQFLYSLLFQWLVEMVNKKHCKDESDWSNYIAVVDFQGLVQSSPGESTVISHLVTNYAIERIHGFIFEQLQVDWIGLKSQMDESHLLQPLKFKSNDGLLEALSSVSNGIIFLAESELHRINSKADPRRLLAAIEKYHGSNPLVSVFNGYNTSSRFSIQHFSDNVTYDIEKLNCELSSSDVSTDFVSLFCGSMDQPATTVSFIRCLFSKKAIDVEIHPKNRSNILRARQSAVPIRKPSTLRRRTTVSAAVMARQSHNCISDSKLDASNENGNYKGDVSEVKRKPSLVRRASKRITTYERALPSSSDLQNQPDLDVDSKDTAKSSVIEDEPNMMNFDASFLATTQTAMDELLSSFEDMNTWFIFHVSPSTSSTPSNTIAKSDILRQVSMFQLFHIAKYIGISFATKISYDVLLDKLKDAQLCSLNDQQIISSNHESVKDTTLQILQTSLAMHPSSFLAGREYIYLTEYGARYIYCKLNGSSSPISLINGPSNSDSSSTLNASPTSTGLGNYITDKVFCDTNPLEDADPTTKLLKQRPIPQYLNSDKHYTPSIAASDVMTQDEDVLEGGSMYDFTAAANELSVNTDHRQSLDKQFQREIDSGNLVEMKKFDVYSTGKNGVNITTYSDCTSKREFVKKGKKMSRARCCWLSCTWCLTWWIPSFAISCCCRKKTPETRIAWREKVALCLIIFLMCASILFFIIGLGRILCPSQNVLSVGEVSIHNSLADPFVIVQGKYYSIHDTVQTHVTNRIASAPFVSTVLGRDVSAMFYPLDFPDKYCPGMTIPPGWDNVYQRSSQGSTTIWYPHQRSIQTNNVVDYIGQIQYMKKGFVAIDTSTVVSSIQTGNRKVIIAWGRVYDITSYYDPANVGAVSNSSGFFGASVKMIFDTFNSPQYEGKDATNTLQQLQTPQMGGSPQFMTNFKTCMDSLFLSGVVDTRNSLQCVAPNYVLLGASCILVAVIGFKFIGALQLSARAMPEQQQKFAICHVPCYTEDEKSLRRTIDSIASTDYEDKRKLIFIICDGMIIGAGNDRPTPRIVLDILGVDPEKVNPEAQSFISIGQGNRQHNMAKVYSGLYQVEGHVVPFIVVVKVGTPSERNRPGNRGKRDSQLLIMRFLNRVHYKAPMLPLECEMMHHLKNIIGIHPNMYEFMLMVDADTEILPDSLNRMIASMVRDGNVMGLCGETRLSNEQSSWVTMIQVYEYYISHHLSKAFESLFGSVTCLPGCFCMYRLRMTQHDRQTALFVSEQVLNDYSENDVDTLHLKNLLELGEDRYLTTLMLKHFPHLKTRFVQDAVCQTGAPDKWSVFLSQRRRWINSTVHNLFELMFLSQLCGTCCFSMRFVVFIDLFATFLQPASVVYIGYLIYVTIADPTAYFPLVSLIMLAAIYGLQMVIFLLKREWQHVGWMIIYILAMPVFGFFVPLYAFWHFDDFSWGNTRVTAGEEGRNKTFNDKEGANGKSNSHDFDPNSIKTEKWEEYEPKLLSLDRFGTLRSQVSQGGLSTGSSNQSQLYLQQSAPAMPAALNPIIGNRESLHEDIENQSYSAVGYQQLPVCNPTVVPVISNRVVQSPTPYLSGSSSPTSARESFRSTYMAPTEETSYRISAVPRSSTFGQDFINYYQRINEIPIASRPQTAVQHERITNELIVQQVQRCLETADLSQVTKRQVREQVCASLGVPTDYRRSFIDECILGMISL